MVITAAPAGFAAGLFGIGGGLITVPILYYIFNNAGINPTYLMHLAVGTSFAIIIPTSTVSVITHHQHKAVDFGVVKDYGLFVISGVILGTIFAASLKTKPLILFSQRKRERFKSKHGIYSKSIKRIGYRFYIRPYGNWWSSDECTYIKIFWVSD